MSSERNDHSAFCIRGFTLVEMLTVIAIIGILAAILITAVPVVMRKARSATASADITHLTQAATSYNLDFGAFPPDCTAFCTPEDAPFPGAWNTNQNYLLQTPLNPNELLVWYLTMQYSAGGQPTYNSVSNTWTYPAVGYPLGYPAIADQYADWFPSLASVVFSRGINAGPYFDLKARQKTDVNQNGFYEFMDPWGRPYMYRAYPQSALVTNIVSVNGATVVLALGSIVDPNPNAGAFGAYNGYTYWNEYPFFTNGPLASTTGSIQLSGFTNSYYNGTFAFQGVPYNSTNNPNNNQVTMTLPAAPGPTNQISTNPVAYGYYTFPLHNKQSCDIYSLGPYGLTRAASSMPSSSNVPQEWKPTHGGVLGNPPPATPPSLDPSSLDAWPQVWGTPGDGNDINSTNGNIIVNVMYQDNICNWN